MQAYGIGEPPQSAVLCVERVESREFVSRGEGRNGEADEEVTPPALRAPSPNTTINILYPHSINTSSYLGRAGVGLRRCTHGTTKTEVIEGSRRTGPVAFGRTDVDVAPIAAPEHS